jgi:hypothetical protein
MIDEIFNGDSRFALIQINPSSPDALVPIAKAAIQAIRGNRISIEATARGAPCRIRLTAAD